MITTRYARANAPKLTGYDASRPRWVGNVSTIAHRRVPIPPTR